ncbi:hypothetical protein niasHT_016587 [Heterodera trifolii]|uniref:Uncharacterized protein n=1 Tax=Heterodera trifolii TaxID=157864 RepID=A0ABD2LA58_9BILA
MASSSAFRKASQQEFQHQIKEIRAQLFDQVKCLEQRTDMQVAILGEINDFVRRKAELDSDYSKQVDKLVKSVMVKHKNEKMKRANWALHSTCQLWQQLVDDAKEEARQRSIGADVCANYVCPAIAQRTMALQKIAKKCREIGVLAQSEVVRVLHELHTAMKTYQHCFCQFNALGGQLQQAEAQRNKVGPNSSTRKQRSAQKTYEKKSEKYASARLKCTRARNEYLLCIDAANASLHKFFADDISDLIDCTDLGMDWWLSLLLQNMITARKSACQVEMNALANLGTFKESLQSAADKQRFFESNHQAFMLPKRFDFRCDEVEEHVTQISVAEGSLADEFRQRHHQIRKRLATLRAESEMSWQTMEGTERQIRDLLTTCTVVHVSEFGIAADDDRRQCCDSAETELAKAYDAYMQTFSYYLYTANLIMRLEARADGIGNALLNSSAPAPSSSSSTAVDDHHAQLHNQQQQQNSSPSRLTVCGTSICSQSMATEASIKNNNNTNNGTIGGPTSSSVASSSIAVQRGDNQLTLTDLSERSDSLEWAQRNRKKRIGSQASTELAPGGSGSGGGTSAAGAVTGATSAAHMWRRPRLFGGSLEEYTDLTGEPIPLVVVSCIRILSQHALHHQGLFRISGSQLEINHMREAFESGDDPLREVHDANDANSIAGLLKLYLRELREPLFPFYLFDLLTDCAKCSTTADFVSKICPLLNKLPRATYLLLRYLFAFLNHLSELSDENMMDPYNLAICFGPTLLPIPEGKDQVHYQNSVNEVVKNLIVHSDAIFTARVPGPRYEKYAAIESTDGGDGTPAGDISADLELFVDDEVSTATAAAAPPLDNWPSSSSTLLRHHNHHHNQHHQQLQQKRLSSADLPFPPPSPPQFHRFHCQMPPPPSSASAASSPQQQPQHQHQQQQQQQRLPFLANYHPQLQQQQQRQNNGNDTEHQAGQRLLPMPELMSSTRGSSGTTAAAAGTSLPLRMDWSMCSGTGGGEARNIGEAGTATTPSSSTANNNSNNHQRRPQQHNSFFASNANGGGEGNNNNNNNYCYSSSESGIADPTPSSAANGIGVTSPRLAAAQQQQQQHFVTLRRQCGGDGDGLENVSDLYASIHKGESYQQQRHGQQMPSTVVAAAQQQHVHRSPPPVIVRLGNGGTIQTVVPNARGDQAVQRHQQQQQQAHQQYHQQQQSSYGVVSPPPYNALYSGSGARTLASSGAAASTQPMATTSSAGGAGGGGQAVAAAQPSATIVVASRMPKMISPLLSGTTTAASSSSIYPSPARRRNSFHDNSSVMPTFGNSAQQHRPFTFGATVALDKLPPSPSARIASSPPCKPKATIDHQLKQQRHHQISAIDDLLGKLSSATSGGSGDDHQKQ